MFKSIIYIVVVNQDRLISAVPHLYYHRRLIYRLYFTVSYSEEITLCSGQDFIWLIMFIRQSSELSCIFLPSPT